MANVCIEMCESMYQIPTRIVCFLLMLLQGVILDYYLVTYKNVYWYGWVAADVAISFIVIMAFVISYRHLSIVHTSSKDTPVHTGSLPLGYFTWGVYSCALAARVAIIFKDFAWQLKEADFFGPNTLKISISLTGFIFILVLLTHHDALPGTERKRYIDELTATVVFDVLDSVDILDILFDMDARGDFPVAMDYAIISIACANLILPVIPLIILSGSHFGHKQAPEYLMTVHRLLLVFMVNLPLLVIRLLLWHVLSKEISVFPVKNVVMIFLVFHDMYEKRRTEIQAHDSDVVDGSMQRYDEELDGDSFMCRPDD